MSGAKSASDSDGFMGRLLRHGLGEIDGSFPIIVADAVATGRDIPSDYALPWSVPDPLA